MEPSTNWSRTLIIIGLAATVVGAIDPLEGCVVVLVGAALIATGSLIARSRHRVLACWAVGLVAVGIAVMVVLSWLGGIGGNSGRTLWWAILIAPYPVGWILAVVTAAAELIPSGKRQTPRQVTR